MSGADEIPWLEHRVAELEKQLKALTKRVDQLERPPTPRSTRGGNKPMPTVIVSRQRR
jgi:hypothetical protein